jgi:hypothetical protein
MDPTVEDDVGHTTRYMIDEGAIAGFQAIQDDDPPQSIVDFDFIGTGLWYYDESLMANYLPYVDENNQIWVSTTDDIWPGMPGSGFDKGSSYAQFRVGVERNSATSWWTPGWRDCDDVNFPGGVWFDVQNDIVADGNIGGAPRGYYIIQFRVQDDVGNNIRLGDGTNEIVDVVSGQMFDSSRIYFKIARDFSWYHGTGDTTNGYTVSGSETFNQAAISVSDLDIPAGATLTLRDTEVFLDSTFNGERHVDVQGTLRTDSMSNTAGYDQRSAFTRRGLISHSGGPTDSQYTFWVRDAAILDMANTVVEGCGFSAVDPTRDDNGLYIRTDIVNADIVNSEIRFGYDGVVVQDGGGVTIDFSDIHDNSNNGISAYYSTNSLNIWNSDIHDNGAQGIHLDGSYADIDNNNINDNGQDGIWIGSGIFGNDPALISMGWADITNNVIDNNGDDGIDMRRSFYAPESAHSDNIAFYSGIGNDVDRNLTYTFDLSDLNPGARATLTFWLWYNMGGDADDGFNVLYWNDTWARWMPLIPVGSYDTGNTPGYQYGAVSGLDGQPGFASQNTLTYWTDDGWTQVEYDLTMFSGNPSVELRFRYGTDTTMYSTGCFIDLMEIPELEPYSASVPWQWDFESSDPLWTPNGWTRRDFVNNQFPETYIFNNNITNNNGEGIDAEYSDFECISNRILDGNDEGLYLHNFIDAVVDDCIIDDNSQEGIDMENWVYLIITDSEITNSDNNDGIQADDYCRLDIDRSVMNWNNGDGVDVDEFCD